MRSLKMTLTFILLCLIASCSLVKTFYNNAPEATHWWLDDYFNFTQAQSAILKPALYELHDWHRKTQLPAYVNLMQQIQNDLSQEAISAETVCSTIKTMQDYLQSIQVEAIPIILEIAPTLNEKQLVYFEKKLHKRAQKWQSEWLQETPEAQIAARLEKIVDYSERLYGNLNTSQKAMLKQKLLTSDFKPEVSFKDVLRRNEDMLHTFKTLASDKLHASQQQQLLRQAIKRLYSSPNKYHQRYAEDAKKRSCEILAELHATTDNQQKQHAIAWLEKLMTQFKALSYASLGE
jgi:hypothetical protein